MVMKFYIETREQFAPGGCALSPLLGSFRAANGLAIILWVCVLGGLTISWLHHYISFLLLQSYLVILFLKK